MTPMNWQDHDLTHPLSITDPHRIDVPDLFGDGYDDDQITELFAVMAATPRHTYMLATEHPQVMADSLSGKWLPHSDTLVDGFTRRFACIVQAARGLGFEGDISIPPLPNFLPGVLVRTQREANERIPVLLGVQAAARFVLCEPREAVDLATHIGDCECFNCGKRFIDNQIGPRPCPHCYAEDEGDIYGVRKEIHGVRVRGGDAPMHPDHVRSLRDQCAAAGVAFAFEGWGEWAPASIVSTGPVTHAICRHGCVAEFTQGAMRAACSECNAWEGLRRVGRAASGRLLDGVQHDAYPQLESEVGR